MNHVRYPTDTEEEMSNIHEEHKTQLVKNFTEAAKSLNKVVLQNELEVGSVRQRLQRLSHKYWYNVCGALR